MKRQCGCCFFKRRQDQGLRSEAGIRRLKDEFPPMGVCMEQCVHVCDQHGPGYGQTILNRMGDKFPFVVKFIQPID